MMRGTGHSACPVPRQLSFGSHTVYVDDHASPLTGQATTSK
jgi:hypothetical protein